MRLRAGRAIAARMRTRAGDSRRVRAIVLLSAVLALDGADLGTLGAVAAELERSLRIGNLAVGVLASVVSLTAAVVTLPVGWLTDRVSRVPLLAGSIALWSAAMLVTGAAVSFEMLLVSRVFLGAVQATSGPTLASLTGDLFQARERSGIFGFIHAGELLGAGLGFVISGEAAAALSWRWSFWILALPGFVLAVGLWRGLPEPARGGADRFSQPELDRGPEEIIHRLVREQRVSPHRDRLLDACPGALSPFGAGKYLLQIRTNLLLMVALALGYFFLGGARTFGVIFFRGHYRLGQAAAIASAAVLGVGALLGVLVGGRLADRLLRRGRLNARIVVGGVGYLAAAALFVPPIVVTGLPIALPLYVLAAGALTAPSPALDAAVLDVVPAGLWGRAEGILTAARTLAMAAAPALFGLLADTLDEGGRHRFGEGTFGSGSQPGAQGLEVTFLIMLVSLAVAGLVLVRARSTYPRDVATALACEVTPASPTARERGTRRTADRAGALGRS
jgi:MFS family permease